MKKMPGHGRPRPQILWIFLLSLWINLFLAEGINDWPTYKHPTYDNRKCYLCPPGYFKIRDCPATRDVSPQWPTCLPCPGGQYSRRWNQDGRCWDHDYCDKNHMEIHNGGNTGPTKCACTGATLEDESGLCVDGITKKLHLAEIETLREWCDAQMKAATKEAPNKVTSTTVIQTTQPDNMTAEASPLCNPCQIHSEVIPLWGGILIGWFFGIATTCFALWICWKWKKYKKMKNKEIYYRSTQSVMLPLVSPMRRITQDTVLLRNGHNTASDSGLQNGILLQGNQEEMSPIVPLVLVPRQPKPVNIESAPPVQVVPVAAAASTPPTINNKRKSGNIEEMTVAGSHTEQDKEKRHSRADTVTLVNDDQQTPMQPKKTTFKSPRRDEVKASPIDGAATHMRPKRQPVESDDLDDALRIIERRMTSTKDADFIMRHVFGFKANECEKIKNENQLKPTETIRAGFNEWKEKRGKKATVGNLIASLIKHEKVMMAHEIADSLGIQIPQETEAPTDGSFDDIVKICETVLTPEAVREFFRSELELDETDSLFQDRNTFIRKGLMSWKNKKAKKATPQKLLQLLSASGFKNEACVIGKKFNELLETIGGTTSHSEAATFTADKAIPIVSSGTTTSGTVAEIPVSGSLSSEPSSPSSTGTSVPRVTFLSSTRPGGNPQADSMNIDRGRATNHIRPSRFSPTGDIQMVNLSPGPSDSIASTSSHPHPYPSALEMEPRGELEAECKRVENADDSNPIMEVEYADEEPHQHGKAGADGETEGDATTFGKDDKKALKRAAKVVGKKVTSIEEADYVMRHILQFRAVDCERIRHENDHKPREVLRIAFKEWQQRQGRDASVENLLKTLRKHDRNSLAQEIVQVLNKTEKGDFDACKDVENEADSNPIEDIEYADAKTGGDGKTEGDTTTFDEGDTLALRKGQVDKNLNKISDDAFSAGLEPTSQNEEINEDTPYTIFKTQNKIIRVRRDQTRMVAKLAPEVHSTEDVPGRKILTY